MKLEGKNFKVEEGYCNIPENDDGLVDLLDYENGSLNICNFNKPEVRDIFSLLDPFVKSTLDCQIVCTNVLYESRGRKIRFSVEIADEDCIWVTGLEINDAISETYCHDFAMIGVTLSDWNKVKACFE